MRQETLIGEVEMSCRLISSSASVRNIRAATPGCERMPAPMSATLPRSEISSISIVPIVSCARASARRVASHVVLRHRERELGGLVADVLEDGVDVHVLGGDRFEDRGGGAGPVGNADEVEEDLVLASA